MDDKRSGSGKPLRETWLDERCYVSEWWNRHDDEPVSVARVRVEPGVTTALHRLRDITERYLILSGRGRVEVDGRTRDVGPGDRVLIPPGISQRITNTGEKDLGFLAVCTPRFRPDAYEDLEANSPAYSRAP